MVYEFSFVKSVTKELSCQIFERRAPNCDCWM